MTSKMVFSLAFVGLFLAISPGKELRAGQDSYIGEIIWGGWNYCPRGTVPANGNLYAIDQHQSLFSLIGTQFGGDGRTTFAVPNLIGRVAISAGQSRSSGNSRYQVGDEGGQETVTLTTSQLAAHNHAVNASANATVKDPTGNIPGAGKQKIYDTPDAASTKLADEAVVSTGAGEAHENRPPFLTLTACIVVEGIYPPRN